MRRGCAAAGTSWRRRQAIPPSLSLRRVEACGLDIHRPVAAHLAHTPQNCYRYPSAPLSPAIAGQAAGSPWTTSTAKRTVTTRAIGGTGYVEQCLSMRNTLQPCPHAYTASPLFEQLNCASEALPLEPPAMPLRPRPGFTQVVPAFAAAYSGTRMC